MPFSASDFAAVPGVVRSQVDGLPQAIGPKWIPFHPTQPPSVRRMVTDRDSMESRPANGKTMPPREVERR
jgi:hypothetical protein